MKYLHDPRVDWDVHETEGYIGNTEWAWQVAVGGDTRGGSAYDKAEAIERANDSARRLLGEGERIGNTRPCPICSKPSRFAQETDTDECTSLLTKARAELTQLPRSVTI